MSQNISVILRVVLTMFEGTWGGPSFVLNNTGDWEKEYEFP